MAQEAVCALIQPLLNLLRVTTPTMENVRPASHNGSWLRSSHRCRGSPCGGPSLPSPPSRMHLSYEGGGAISPITHYQRGCMGNNPMSQKHQCTGARDTAGVTNQLSNMGRIL